ncbi:MAG: hypothetical protein AB4040_07085 [Synechococcus sp.]
MFWLRCLCPDSILDGRVPPSTQGEVLEAMNDFHQQDFRHNSFSRWTVQGDGQPERKLENDS